MNCVCGITGFQTRSLVGSDVYMATSKHIPCGYCRSRSLSLQWHVGPLFRCFRMWYVTMISGYATSVASIITMLWIILLVDVHTYTGRESCYGTNCTSLVLMYTNTCEAWIKLHWHLYFLVKIILILICFCQMTFVRFWCLCLPCMHVMWVKYTNCWVYLTAQWPIG